ncbi:MAG: sulfatase-like hydrolase/transferase [Bacteroidia bacterium]
MNNWLLLLLSVCISIGSCKRKAKSPNIILIMTDDQGWFDTGFNGNTEIKTPWLDSLATSGIIFDRFYAASAVCSPTRASLITGRNPLRMNIPYANSGHMLAEEITIAEILKKEKYATAHFGKWHLGTLTKSVVDANRGGRDKFSAEYTIPTEHGYDSFFCTESKVPTFDPMVLPDSFMTGEGKRYGWRARAKDDSISSYGTAYWSGSNQKETLNLEGDDSRIIMDRVIPFIEGSIAKEQSFFTTIWFHTPHLPVVSDSIHRDYYRELPLDKQLYYGTITALDEQIGSLWQLLEDRGIAEETILFFCSDNGPERQTPGSAGIFRERKRSLYEGGIRVPAFVIWKNNLEGGQRVDFPAVTSDYLPTILDMLKLEYPAKRPIDGVSIWDLLNGAEKERTKPIGFICKPQISWVTDQYKLIGDDQRESFELYDLLNDPSEKKDIIDQHPEIAESMKSDLFAWLKSVEDSKAGKDYH